MRELLSAQPLFIGFKVDTRLMGKLQSLKESDQKYVSSEDSTLLQICMLGEDPYVGKLVGDRLTTDRVEDIRRHVLSIIRKLGTEIRLPTNLHILACRALDGDKINLAPRHLD